MDPVFGAGVFLCATFVVAGAQDLLRREIADYTWIIAIPSLFFLAQLPIHLLLMTLSRFVLMVLIGFIMLKKLGSGEADSIAIAILGLDPRPEGIVKAMVFTLLALLPFIFLKKRRRRIVGIEELGRDKDLIPLALLIGNERIDLPKDVDKAYKKLEEFRLEGKHFLLLVESGVPFVLFLAIGYLSSFLPILFL